jgi:hypothetical protein
MTDLKERFGQYRNVPVPDLWERITDRALDPATTARRPRPNYLAAVAATVVMLLAVGLPVLLVGLRDSTKVIELNPAESPWEAVAVDPPATDSIVEIEPLQDGFVALVANPGRVLWTPNGRDWFDADPLGLVDVAPPTATESELGCGCVVATTGELVMMVDKANRGVWTGNHTTGGWEWISLTGVDPAEDLVLLGITANDREGLVIASQIGSSTLEIDDPEEPLSIPSTGRYLSWTIRDGEAEQHVLPIATPEWSRGALQLAAWVDRQWIVGLFRGSVWDSSDEGWEERQTLLTSPDGVTWSAFDTPQEWGSPTSLTAGPSGIIATTCHFGGDSFWHSADGSNWTMTTSAHIAHQSGYVDGLGFVVSHEDTPSLISRDGREWQSPSELGVTLQPLASTGEIDNATEGHLFQVGSQLWVWSTD